MTGTTDRSRRTSIDRTGRRTAAAGLGRLSPEELRAANKLDALSGSEPNA